ncbi:protein-ER retention protein-like protein [Calycina marina]|uniref:Protein-ER retention protein-like protein n=1 Tax=Calycina marina TaxID=1763456 RepID=A0A9P7Z5W2_9HELO|nr:protein-ER retention protein-like protein [Calycina marina]
MDGDPHVEPELDSFSRTLPLPYRVAMLVVLGVWAWGVNLHFLALAKIDVPSLIKYPHRTSPRTDPPHHLSTYRLATLLTIPLSVSLLLFWALSHRNPDLVIYYDFLPIAYLCLLVALFILPLRRFSHAGRIRFLTTVRRISIGGIAEAANGKFGDILLADVLTSYAKVIADLFVALCMFFQANGSATARPDRACGGQYLVPIIVAIPSTIRLRQCMVEYHRVRDANRKDGGIGVYGWGGQHLANALKYSSAFPVIILSALQRNLSVDNASIGVSAVALYRSWLVAVFINSFYSFYWDVAKDWDLSLFSTSRTSHLHAYGLRQRLSFRTPEIYYFAIATDLLLRCTWSLKLSPHLDHFADFESGIFLMECLEIGRRWMWIFFRVETEWVRTSTTGTLGAPGQMDVLMHDYSSGSGAYDSD